VSDLNQLYFALSRADAAGDAEGARQLAAYIRQQGARPEASSEARAQSQANIAADQASYSPTAGRSNIAAGFGKALVDLGRGAGQMLSVRGQPVVSRQDIAESRQTDAPLMATTGGKVGNFAGNVAAIAPAMFVPGANTVAGAGLIGAATGLLQPSESTGETATNVALGGALGAGGQKLGQVAGSAIGKFASGRASQAADDKSANAVRDQIIAEARKVGYKVPPATVNQTSTVARTVESLAGKDAMKQTAAVGNQKVTDRLVREEFGLPRGAPLSKTTLHTIRQKEGGVYKAVKESGDIMADQQYLSEIDKLGSVADEVANDFPDFDVAGSAEIQKLRATLGQQGFSAPGAVEMLKELRHQASKNLAWNVEDPAKKALGLSQREAAGILEEQVMRHLQGQGKDALAAAFDKSRQTIAKTYSVQAALNEGSGHIVAGKLAAQLRKGKPLSGNLEKIARFASAVDAGVVKEMNGSPGVSALVASLATAGGAGGLALGNPAAAAVAAGVPLTREIARRGLLTRAGQAMSAPRYKPAGNTLLELMQRSAPLSAPVAIGLGNAE
jgi:hypothetical protein